MRIVMSEYCKIIKRTVVLDCINAEFHAGLIHLIQGANASGKTMLLRALAGLIKPTSGSLRFVDVPHPKKMGILIGLPSFVEDVSAFKNLLWLAMLNGGTECGEAKQLAFEALERFCIDPTDRRHLRRLSLGTRQKVALANALMGSPDVVLLDEPFNGLDASSLENALAQLVKERNRGAIVIVVSHQCPQLLSAADKVYSLDSGRLVS